MEPPNNGHFGDMPLVLCREVVPFSEGLIHYGGLYPALFRVGVINVLNNTKLTTTLYSLPASTVIAARRRQQDRKYVHTHAHIGSKT